MRKSKLYYATVTCVVLAFAFIGKRVQADSDKFYSNLIRLDKVISKISENYVENVSSDELVDAAITGIRGILDPHTAYFTPKDYEELKVSTDGEFGGLGIQIGMRDQILTVVSPLVGTPAYRMGLQAGDEILRIDTLSTEGMTIDDAVDKLRGRPGTLVKLTIGREGAPKPLEFTITREIIKIASVPYAALLPDSMGYVKVTQFAKRTSEDLEAKLDQLKKQHAKGLILDLRFNPGGLLNQAIGVSELFLPKNDLVVFTKGRVASQNQEYRSDRDPVWTKNMVILVNENSASAAEIVAGAMQDWDRGVVMGQNTYGKGSVQTILPLDGQEDILKLTTAYYYTPSGRCINKPENAVRFKHEEAVRDSLRDDTDWFKTHDGRRVLAGGGIMPDVLVPDPHYSRYDQELLRKTMFFDFVIQKRPELSAQGKKIDSSFQVTPQLLDEFKKFVYSDTTFTHFKSAAQLALENVREAWKKDREDRGDTADAKALAGFDQAAAPLAALLRADVDKEFALNLDFIKQELKAEFLGTLISDDARTDFEIKHDGQVAQALRYLENEPLYSKVLRKAKNKG